MRAVAISTNKILISKIIEGDSSLSQFKSKYVIAQAAKWMYRHYGFGRCSRDLLMCFINEQYFTRLYNSNVKLWLSISKFVFERDKYTCQYCGKVGGILEVDHIIPISRNGSNELENLCTSCRRCNRQKKDKSVLEFLKWRENNV